MATPRGYYDALTSFNLTYSTTEVKTVIKRWDEGVSLSMILDEVRDRFDEERTIDELNLLIFDLSYTGKLKPREGGIYGKGVTPNRRDKHFKRQQEIQKRWSGLRAAFLGGE